jgi:hypothetical protein
MLKERVTELKAVRDQWRATVDKDGHYSFAIAL